MNDKVFPLGLYGTQNVFQVVVDFLFPDSKFLRDLKGVHRPFAQACNDLLAECFHYDLLPSWHLKREPSALTADSLNSYLNSASKSIRL